MVGKYRQPVVTWLLLSTFIFRIVAPPDIASRFLYAQTNAQATVPAVIGLTAAEAVNVLKSAGLAADVHLGVPSPREFSRLGVYEVTPPVGSTVARGTSIRLVIHADEVDAVAVTSGVPDVIGRSVAEARRMLATAGLETKLRLGFPSADARKALQVYSQSPQPGQPRAADRPVQIVFYAPSFAQVATRGGPAATMSSTGALSAVQAQPFIDERTEKVRFGSGVLDVEQLDLSVPAGILSLEVRRYLRIDGGEPGLLGSQWRLGWEKRLVHRDGAAALREKAGWVEFRPIEAAGSYVSALGDVLTIKASTARCVRADDTRETYDAAGRLIEVDARNGNLIRLQYDTAGRLNRVEGPFGSFLSLVTDNDGRLVQASGSNGATVRYFYGSAVDAPAEARVRFGYDAAGMLNTLEFPGEGQTLLDRDAQGRVVARRFADGTSERWEYDDAAGVQRHIDAVGAVSTRRSTDDGRNVELTSALGHRNRIETDDFGRPIVITAADGLTARVQYDELGRITSVTRGGEAAQTFTFHADTHVLTARTEHDGKRILRQHDLEHNLLSIAHEQDADKDARFDYLPNGLLRQSVRRGGQAFKLEYDDHGRVARLIDPAGNSGAFEYDQHGRLLRFVDPEGKSTTNDYDRDGRLGRDDALRVRRSRPVGPRERRRRRRREVRIRRPRSANREDRRPRTYASLELRRRRSTDGCN